MVNTIKYKDELFVNLFSIEKINHKFHNNLFEKRGYIYRLVFFLYAAISDSIDIYISDYEREILGKSLYKVLIGNEDSIELEFQNKISKKNSCYYKILQCLDNRKIHFILNFFPIKYCIKLKIYRDKNFIIIRPEISCSYLLKIMKKINITILPIILSKDSIDNILINM